MSYVGSAYSDLIKTEPSGTNEPVSNLDDGLRQVKRYLVDTLGDPAASGTIHDAIAASVGEEKVPLGSILSYTKSGIWTAPLGYLKCDGNTIGNVSSGAFYEGVEYEALFEQLKSGYGNVGDEIWAAGDTVKLPMLSESSITGGENVITDVTEVSGNGGSASAFNNGHYDKRSSVFGPIDISQITTAEPLDTLDYLTFDVNQWVWYNQSDPGRTMLSFRAAISLDSGNTYEDVFYTGYQQEADNSMRVTGYLWDYLQVSIPTRKLFTAPFFILFEATYTGGVANGAGFQATLTKAIGAPAAQKVNFIIKAT